MIPLFRVPHIADVQSKLGRVIEKGQHFDGINRKHFESEVARFVGAKYLLAFNTLYSAYISVLAQIGVGPGDEVIMSPLCCLAATQPVAMLRARIVWCDIDPRRGSIDPEEIRKKLTKHTKAIIAYHWCGVPARMDEICRIGAEHGVPIIEDATEAFGTLIGGHYAGSCNADYTVFSFQSVRIPTTIEGGGVVYRREEDWQMGGRVRDYGIDRMTFRQADGEICANADISIIGVGGIMSEMSALIGCSQLESLGALVDKQRMNGVRVASACGCCALTCSLPKGDMANGWVTGVLCANRERLRGALRDNGIQSSGIHIRNDNYSLFGRGRCDLPRVEEFSRQFIAVPSGWWLTESELESICDTLEKSCSLHCDEQF